MSEEKERRAFMAQVNPALGRYLDPEAVAAEIAELRDEDQRSGSCPNCTEVEQCWRCCAAEDATWD